MIASSTTSPTIATQLSAKSPATRLMGDTGLAGAAAPSVPGAAAAVDAAARLSGVVSVMP